jgi:hypothetical protein
MKTVVVHVDMRALCIVVLLAGLTASCASAGGTGVSARPVPVTQAGKESDIESRGLSFPNDSSRLSPSTVPLVPPPPSNGGQCVIAISAGQTYRHSEIQRWVVTGPPVQSAPGKLYPVLWTTTGSGFLHEDNGLGTKNDLKWGISGTRTTQFRGVIIASTRNWLVEQAETAFNVPGGITGTQQQTINNVSQPAGVISAQDFEFSYPAITAPGNLTQIMEMKQFPVDQNHKYGYVQPATATGTVSCQWNLTMSP